MLDKRPPRLIQVLGRADALLAALAASPRPLSLTELFRAVHLNKSTTLNILATLVELGFVYVVEGSKRYRLGPRLLQLGTAFEASLEIAEIARPALIGVRDATGETASLHIRTCWERTSIAQEASLHSVRRVVELGRRRPLYVGSAGYVLLSGLAPEQVRAYIEGARIVPSTPRTTTDKSRILSAVETTRACGFALAIEETESDASGAAVAIHDHTGAVLAALVVSGPSSRFDRPSILAAIPVMQQLAADVSRQLGYVAQREAPTA